MTETDPGSNWRHISEVLGNVIKGIEQKMTPAKSPPMNRRTFTLLATAGCMLPAEAIAAPPEILADAKAALPDQHGTLHLLDERGQAIEGMSRVVRLAWIGDEFLVMDPLTWEVPRTCIVTAFMIQPILPRGTLDHAYYLAEADWFSLQVKLSVAPS
jgi:hypothetical protein